MSPRSGLATVIRLAELQERKALGELARALKAADDLRSELRVADDRAGSAMRAAWLEPTRIASAGTLAAANNRARVLSSLALEIQPRVEVAQLEVERVREKATAERLRTRGLRRASERREAARRMEQRRSETRRVDELVRAVRGKELVGA
jgi:flagellar export protein FliJ